MVVDGFDAVCPLGLVVVRGRIGSLSFGVVGQ